MSGPKILCVDDDKMILDFLKMTLEPAGYEFRFSRSGEDALKQMASDMPDLVLLDIGMPGMSGLEVLKKMAADEKMRRVPVIMLTCSNEFEHIKEALEDGAVMYIYKPFERDTLLSMLEGFLSKY